MESIQKDPIDTDPLEQATRCRVRTRVRTILNENNARQIFKLKYNNGFASTHSASVHWATAYHVSSKTIRDIWKGRTWLQATFDLWAEEDRPSLKSVGRPKGKKDSKPRKRFQPVARHSEAEQPQNIDLCVQMYPPASLPTTDYPVRPIPPRPGLAMHATLDHILQQGFTTSTPWTSSPSSSPFLDSFPFEYSRRAALVMVAADAPSTVWASPPPTAFTPPAALQPDGQNHLLAVLASRLLAATLLAAAAPRPALYRGAAP